MLVLGRKKGEAVYVGDNVRVVVIEARPDGFVRLGFEAPPEVAIEREELRRKRLDTERSCRT